MTIASVNPATGETVATFETLDAGGVESVLADADSASPSWGSAPLSARLEVLQRAADLLRERRSALAALITLEMGKLESEATAEIDKCAVACEYYVRTPRGSSRTSAPPRMRR